MSFANEIIHQTNVEFYLKYSIFRLFLHQTTEKIQPVADCDWYTVQNNCREVYTFVWYNLYYLSGLTSSTRVEVSEIICTE